jgi:hypothetical protein
MLEMSAHEVTVNDVSEEGEMNDSQGNFLQPNAKVSNGYTLTGELILSTVFTLSQFHLRPAGTVLERAISSRS